MKKRSKVNENVLIRSNDISEVAGKRVPLTDATNKMNISDSSYNLKPRKSGRKSTERKCLCCIDQTNSNDSSKRHGIKSRKASNKRASTKSTITKAQSQQENEVQKAKAKNIANNITFKTKARNVEKSYVLPEKQEPSTSATKYFTRNGKKSKLNKEVVEESLKSEKFSPNVLEYMKSAYVLIEPYNNIHQLKNKRIFNVSPVATTRRASNPIAVYDFVYDKNEDPQQKRKRRPGRPKKTNAKEKSFNIFGTKQSRKPRKNTKKKNKDAKVVSNDLHMVLQEPKLPEVSESLEKETFLLTEGRAVLGKLKEVFNVAPSASAENEIGNDVEVEHDNEVFDDCDVAPSPAADEEVINEPENVAEEITKSFMDEYDSDEPNISIKTSVHILSNVNVCDANQALQTPTQQVFNSTCNNFVNQSNPWRVDLSAIRNNPYMFFVKNTSFTPSYDENAFVGKANFQNRVSFAPSVTNIPSNSITKENVSNQSANVTSTKNQDSAIVNQENEMINNTENIAPRTKTHQTTMLDFVLPGKSKINENFQVAPRKVLGLLNYGQSTPMRSNNSFSVVESPNISRIADEKDNTENIFGFSFLSDDGKENKSEEVIPKKQKTPKASDKKPTRFSPRKGRRPLFEEQFVEEKQEAPVAEEIQVAANETPEVEENVPILLFRDVAGDFTTKRHGRRYERKTPKRPRLPSVDSIESDHEASPELHPKKKRKDLRSKEEEAEADKLAREYNAMFEEIEKYDLCIE